MQLIDALAALGPLAVFPIARPLVADGAPLPRPRFTWAAAFAFGAAFLFARGVVAAIFTLPWLAVALLVLAQDLRAVPVTVDAAALAARGSCGASPRSRCGE